MRILGSLLLLAVSLFLSVLAAELLARTVFDPVDYLLPQVVPDDFLSTEFEAIRGVMTHGGSAIFEYPSSPK